MRKRTMTLIALVVVGLVVLMGWEPPSSHAAPAAPATVGSIAYVLPDDTTGDQIWLINPDGGNNHQIYSTGVADPYHVDWITSLAWRPDAAELAFASNHEKACSWYASDIYTVTGDGSGYRRMTNAPACAALASYPNKGTVNVPVLNLTYDSLVFVYIQGAPSIKSIVLGSGLSTDVQFTNVADLGPGVQPIVGIDGLYRSSDSWVNVIANATVDAPMLTIGGGSDDLGAYKPSWRRDGSGIGYNWSCAQIYGIGDHPADGAIGSPLIAQGAYPCLMAWGPTPATANKILYATMGRGNDGIYLVTEGSSDRGTLLISHENYGWIFDLKWLPDGSGFLYTDSDIMTDSANVFRYDFGSSGPVQLTTFNKQYARDFDVSPDGQWIVFELAPYEDFVPYGGASDLYLMKIDGTSQQKFVTSGAHPSWSRQAVKVPLKTYLPLVRR